MKSLFKKRIVDERMELQSLKNARKSWNFLLIATGLCLLAELHLLQWELKYVLPQAVIVLAASLYNIFLDTRDGNIYTAESANRKRLFLLYSISSLAASLIIASGFYRRYSLITAIIIFIILFFFMFGLMYLFDSLIFHMGKKRALKDTEEEEYPRPELSRRKQNITTTVYRRRRRLPSPSAA